MSKLIQGGLDRILKKVVEESGEVALAAKNEDSQEIITEMADLWFHTLLLLGYVGVSPQDVYQELGRRLGNLEYDPKRRHRQMNDCIFCQIVKQAIPARKVFEDDHCLAFEDINPQAPVHVLVIPKRHLSSLADAQDIGCDPDGTSHDDLCENGKRNGC